ncbi:ribonuclease E/G [Pontixanthobacter aestiaquae]|uniref:Ribonuclease E n=1 Tax=Pontixanthobacter aestiaquae TaxID=1509367 RepID=A0A844Z716_9SPHN|nr:ribonuclease E/G [Pontixanthobacter aestiaquae]MDN3645293.1 ribonuclease E/G [Pontixanthobacter aestiaquae]MXO83705.1 Rne/Rng family ribonuclease [Pontixanthobacter aestiaquae]
MATRMLIDARHSEETRVAVLKGNRIEEFDFESAEHKQIKGNIYLAKVTRVEPSLQAAFVDFGGNRHGFLAFNEIHPDYYQIPKEDREALLAEEAEAAEEEARLRNEEEEDGNVPGEEYDADDESSEALAEDLAEDGMEEIDTSEKDKVATIEEGHVDGDDDDDSDDDDSEEDEDSSDDDDDDGNKPKGRRGRGRRGRTGKKGGRRQGGGKGRSRAKEVDEVRAKRMALRRRYKIQDVIQRRQVLLVQVVKEERGNKGAALTTYLSLAGRYTVLMPNSSHGGGISRKISSAQDRKRLKQIVGDLQLPKTMGLIVRTAGLSRTKTEIKRDFDYLARLWDEIRNNTLGSSAPALIHSDSDLIKRAIRDIYNREIEEVIVEGEDGYKSAKAFMKMLMPSHARRVKAYSDPVPLFQRYGAEDQLRAMYDPVVQLKSGGYLVINPTEALVSIDINSGRSTKEHGIEQTATATNVEAAREIARQLRLRDMAGLVVIDFIDMEYNSNVRKVERAMKDSLKNDRARIQVGRISGFGLMEMSRQRLRTGVLEASTRECPHCDGTGLVRTASSAGLSALRLIEDEAAKGKGTTIQLGASTEAAVYLLNTKRSELTEIEDRYNVTVEVLPEGEDEGAKMTVASSGPRPTEAPKFEPIVDDDDDDDDDIEEDAYEDDEDDRPKKRRSRGGRGRKKNNDNSDNSGSDQRGNNRDEELDEDGKPKKKRRRRGGRGRRGGRNRNNNGGENGDNNGGDNEITADDAKNLDDVSEQVKEDMSVVAGPDNAPQTAGAAAEEKPKRKRAPRKKKVDETATEETEVAEKPKRTRRKKADADAESPTAGEAEKPKAKRAPRKKKADVADAPSEETAEKPKPKRAPRKKKADAEPADETKPATKAKSSAKAEETASEEKPAKKRGGWWQRTFGE